MFTASSHRATPESGQQLLRAGESNNSCRGHSVHCKLVPVLFVCVLNGVLPHSVECWESEETVGAWEPPAHSGYWERRSGTKKKGTPNHHPPHTHTHPPTTHTHRCSRMLWSRNRLKSMLLRSKWWLYSSVCLMIQTQRRSSWQPRNSEYYNYTTQFLIIHCVVPHLGPCVVPHLGPCVVTGWSQSKLVQRGRLESHKTSWGSTSLQWLTLWKPCRYISNTTSTGCMVAMYSSAILTGCPPFLQSHFKKMKSGVDGLVKDFKQVKMPAVPPSYLTPTQPTQPALPLVL